MANPIRDGFDQIHADKALKQHTKDLIRYRLARRRGQTFRRVCAATICLAMTLFGGYWTGFHPVAVISVDVNPSIELGVNRFDRVVWVKGYNESGQALARAFPVRFKNYVAALREILADQELSSYLQTEDDEIVIVVVGATENSEMARQVTSCAAERPQTTCHVAAREEVESAHEVELSYGKYMAYLELRELEPAFTPDDIRSMTMREIRDLITRLSEENQTSAKTESETVPAPSATDNQTETVPNTQKPGKGYQHHGGGHHH